MYMHGKSALLFLLLLPLLFGCSSEKAALVASPGAGAEYQKNEETDEQTRVIPLRTLPQIIAYTPQTAVYSGEGQPVVFEYAGEGKPELMYYASPEARQNNLDGSSAVPVDAGDYHARIMYPRLDGYAPRGDIFVDYRILKCAVTIEVEVFQEAVYNGDQKRIEARAEPPVTLHYSYYPNESLRDAAVSAALGDEMENRSAVTISRTFSRTYTGYRRVERAPTEQGTYYVWIFFPGDENHEFASALAEFTILPPILTNPRF